MTIEKEIRFYAAADWRLSLIKAMHWADMNRPTVFYSRIDGALMAWR